MVRKPGNLTPCKEVMSQLLCPRAEEKVKANGENENRIS